MSRILVSELTPQQRKLICNGCGPKGWGWIVPEFKFSEAGNQHDLDYWVGCNVSDKVLADWRFLNGCLAGAWKARRFRCLLLIVLSFIYFAAVAAGGWGCFWFGKRQRVKGDLWWMARAAEAERHLKG